MVGIPTNGWYTDLNGSSGCIYNMIQMISIFYFGLDFKIKIVKSGEDMISQNIKTMNYSIALGLGVGGLVGGLGAGALRQQLPAHQAGLRPRRI